MDYILILLSFLFAFIGLLGAVVPVLPGPPLSFVGLLMLYFCDGNDVSTTALYSHDLDRLRNAAEWRVAKMLGDE